jgi:hypothetical protein
LRNSKKIGKSTRGAKISELSRKCYSRNVPEVTALTGQPREKEGEEVENEGEHEGEGGKRRDGGEGRGTGSGTILIFFRITYLGVV